MITISHLSRSSLHLIALLGLACLMASCGTHRGGDAPTPKRDARPDATPGDALYPVVHFPEQFHFFSMNGFPSFHLAVRGVPMEEIRASLRDRLREARALGVTSVRTDMWWSQIEPRPGEFSWELPDMVINTIVEEGLEPFPIFCYNSAWNPEQSPSTDEERAAFGEYVHQVVNRYKDRVRVWEVWNEPNITPFWVPQPDHRLYTELLKVVHARAKAADPTCQISAICTSGPDYAFIEGCFQMGAGDHMDMLSYHHYSSDLDESILEGELRNLRRIMDRHGHGSMKINITELGLSTGKSTIISEHTPAQQAEWIVKKHLVARAAGVERFYYFKLKDDAPATDPDGYWGLIDHEGNPKVSWQAYRIMSQKLNGAIYVGNIHGLDRNGAGVECQVYTRGGGDLFAVAWVRNNGEPVTVTIRNGRPVRVINMDGEFIGEVDPRRDGIVRLQLTHEPVYLENLSSDAVQMASARFVPPDVYISAGETVPVNLMLTNSGRHDMIFDPQPLVQQARANGLSIALDQARRIRVLPDERQTVPLRLSLPRGAQPFEHVTLLSPPDSALTWRLAVHHSEPFSIRIRGLAADSGVTARAEIVNLGGASSGGLYQWFMGGQVLGPQQPIADFKPGESITQDINFTPRMGETAVEVRAQSSTGASASATRGVYGMPTVRRAPLIDGDLSDWADVPALHLSPETHQYIHEPKNTKLSSSERVNGSIKVAWSRDFLYLAADVVDATPMQNPFDGTTVWKGDTLELYLGFGGPTDKARYGEGHFQLGISPGSDKSGPYVWNWKPIQPSEAERAAGGRRVENAEIKSRRTARGWQLEAAIPLLEFAERMIPPRAVGFTVHLNDRHDATDARTSPDTVLIWNGNGQNFNDPSNWGIGYVLPIGSK